MREINYKYISFVFLLCYVVRFNVDIIEKDMLESKKEKTCFKL